MSVILDLFNLDLKEEIRVIQGENTLFAHLASHIWTIFNFLENKKFWFLIVQVTLKKRSQFSNMAAFLSYEFYLLKDL
jgi:hypothetical protein